MVLSLPGLWINAAPARGRLLCVLLIFESGVPAEASRSFLLLTPFRVVYWRVVRAVLLLLLDGTVLVPN